MTKGFVIYLCLDSFILYFVLMNLNFSHMNLSEGLWSAMAIINILEGYISWKWSCCHFFWAVWKCPCWYIGSWTSGPLRCCCRFSYNWYDCHIIYMDRKLRWCFWKQEFARPIQGCCCGHCFWYISYLSFMSLFIQWFSTMNLKFETLNVWH